MKIIGSGGQTIADTSRPQYREKAEQLLKQTEENAKLRKQLAEQQARSSNINEQQNTQITQLSAEQELLKLELENQQKLRQEQLETERNHRFASNADSSQQLINSEILKISKRDASNLDSAKEKVSELVNKLNSVAPQVSFGPLKDESINPNLFDKEKLGLKDLSADESLFITKLVLNLNGIKYSETNDALLTAINIPKTNLFIPRADLKYQEAIVLDTGTKKADIYDALLADPKLTEQQATKLVRDLLEKTGVEFTEKRNTAEQLEFHFAKPLEEDLSLRDKTLINGTLANSIIIPSTAALQSIDAAERTENRNNLLKALIPVGLVLGLGVPAGLVITQNPELIGLEKSTPETRLIKEEKQELNELKLKYPGDSRIENSTTIKINREQGENVSQALTKAYPSYGELPQILRQEIEQSILNKQAIPNDTSAYPHGADVISSLPPSIQVPSVEELHDQIKSFNSRGPSYQKNFSLAELYKTLTKAD